MKNLLEVIEVDAYYGIMPALKRVSVTVSDEEVVFVLGLNGAGKTTLLRVISGLIQSTHGDIIFSGQRINGLSTEELVKMGISHVPERRRLFGGLTIMENLEMGAYVRGGSRADIAEDMDMIFSYFPRLLERKSQLTRQLSGGEQQMVAIARGLMSRPSLVLMDEPSLGLSPKMVDELTELIQIIVQKYHTSVLLVEQNVSLALDVGSRGYILQGGEVEFSGSKTEFASSPLLKKAFLGYD